MKASLFILSITFSLICQSAFAQDNQEVQFDHLTISTENSESNSTSKAKFHYYPNLRAYFNTETSEYVYEVNKTWITSKEIPSGYRGYSIYNNHRVELIGYHGDKPYENISEHTQQYPFYSNDRKGKLAALKAKRMANDKAMASN